MPALALRIPRTDKGALYLMRHGRTVSDGVSRYIGQTDMELSPEGRETARIWRQPLAGISFSRICCSDLTRTRETAEIVAAGRDNTLEVIPALREINLGRWEGLSREEVRRDFPEEYEQRGRDFAGHRIPGGESFQDLSHRVLPVIDEICKDLNDNILLATHAGVIRVILCRFLGLPLQNLFRIGLDHGSLTIIAAPSRTPLLTCLNIRPD